MGGQSDFIDSTKVSGGGSSWISTASGLSPDSWWRYGESVGPTASDEQGAADGTYVASPTLAQTGLITGDSDTSVSFNGTTQYVNHGSTTPVDSVWVGGGSLVIWCNPSSAPADATLFAKTNNTSNGWIWRLTDPSGGFYRLRFFQFFASTNGGWNSTNRDVPTTGTTMIGITYTLGAANDPIMYVNGSSVAVTESDAPSGSERDDPSFDLQVGANNGPALFFAGRLDEALFWKGTTLTAQNMLDLFNDGSTVGIAQGSTRWLFQQAGESSLKFVVSIAVTLNSTANLTYDVELTKDRNTRDRWQKISVARATTTATVTLVDHGLAVGDNVQVFNTGDSNLDGSFDVATVTDDDTFTYTVEDTGATSAEGQLISFRVIKHPTLQGLTTAQAGVQRSPVSGIRLKVTNFTVGRADITTLQQG